MLTYRLAALLMAIALIAAIPAGVAAQDEPISPEGQEWTLTGYVADEVVAPVPLGVTATLTLEEGRASGSAGCNSFSGTYVLDGSSLTFGSEMMTTLAVCHEDAEAVEDTYLPLLPGVSAWALDEGVLSLADGFGATVLTYELPTAMLTQSQLDALLAELAELREEVTELRGDASPAASPEPDASPTAESPAPEATTAPTPSPAPTPIAFSGPELVLLEGVADRITGTCEPLRRGLPADAIAAVTCSPSSSLVRRVAYYLMDQGPASEWFHRRMTRNGIGSINEVGGQCRDGYLAVAEGSVGPHTHAQGCFVDSSGRANVHYLQSATDCKVVRTGGERLASPVIYVAVAGESDDVRRLARWSERGAAYDGSLNQISGLTKKIERPRGGWSPGCPVS